jgi:hypothetical protein
MERNFKRPKVGDEYRIKKLCDKGGWPVIRVLSVDGRRHRMMVQDTFLDGTLGEIAALNRGPRDFTDGRGWPKLRKCWMRHKIAAPESDKGQG